jgi:hypothetical protein
VCAGRAGRRRHAVATAKRKDIDTARAVRQGENVGPPTWVDIDAQVLAAEADEVAHVREILAYKCPGCKYGVVKRLECRGYVRREADHTDRRFTNAILLPAGLRKLESTARAHVAYVRHLVIDNLSSERLRRLGQDADRIVRRIDSPAR